MKNKTTYEWVAEHVDEFGDIVAPLFEDKLTLPWVTQAPEPGCVTIDFALVRNVGNDEDGLLDREYFYIADLDEFFKNAPTRFITEAEKFGLIS